MGETLGEWDASSTSAERLGALAESIASVSLSCVGEEGWHAPSLLVFCRFALLWFDSFPTIGRATH